MNRADVSPDPLHGHDTYKKVSECLVSRTLRKEIVYLCEYHTMVLN